MGKKLRLELCGQASRHRAGPVLVVLALWFWPSVEPGPRPVVGYLRDPGFKAAAVL